MTLSVTSASSALAALQTLSLQGLATPPAPADPTQSPIVQTRSSSAGDGAGPTLHGLADQISQAVSAADAGDAAGGTVVGLLQKMRDAAGQASDPTTSPAQRDGLEQAFQANAGQVGAALSSATLNGVNLIDGSRTAGLRVDLGDGGSASLTPVNLTLAGSSLAVSPNASIATSTAAASAFSSLGSAIETAGAALSGLRSQAGQISAHAGVVQALAQSLGSGSAGAIDGDGARLAALQIGQQLSGQTASIANQAPQAILALFRA